MDCDEYYTAQLYSQHVHRTEYFNSQYVKSLVKQGGFHSFPVHQAGWGDTMNL